MERFKEIFRSIGNLRLLGEIARSGGELSTIGDLVDNFLDSPQMELCIKRFRALPGGAELMDSRYPPLDPQLESLEHLPPGSLGHSYVTMIRTLNYDADFFRPRPIESEAQWLTQRIATTHDIHHVVSGFGTSRFGEGGVLAITATQVGFPAYVLLNNAALMAGFRLDTQNFEELSAAISRGVSIGLEAAPLCVQRWEDHWDWSVQQWRQHLGLKNPVESGPYALNLSL
jgi:ubiquinone biosynthesis protein Coq4